MGYVSVVFSDSGVTFFVEEKDVVLLSIPLLYFVYRLRCITDKECH